MSQVIEIAVVDLPQKRVSYLQLWYAFWSMVCLSCTADIDG